MSTTDQDARVRWHIACINWTHNDAPHAVSYAMRDGVMVGEVYHETWAEAVRRVDNIPRRHGGW